MATKLYTRSAPLYAGVRGIADANLRGTNQGWQTEALSTSPGSFVDQPSITTVLGTTPGLEIGGSGALEFTSAPLAGAVTISGTVTFNGWALESNMNANSGLQCVIERLGPTGSVISTVVNSERGAELGTSAAVQNWTASPTSTSFAKGDRIRVRWCANDAGGTMASGHTVTLRHNGATGGADGDTWVEFTETFSLLESDPTGSKYYLRNAASSIADQGAGVTEKELSTTKGAGTSTVTRDTAAGFTAPLQWTVSSGGNTVEWYTPQLNAFTLAGVVRCNVWGIESSQLARAGLNVELAVVNNDGTGANVYGSWGAWQDGGGGGGEMNHLADTLMIAYVCGPDISVTTGQRLRLRARLDDSWLALVSGHTASLKYDGATDAASGDSFLILTETVTEGAGGPAASLIFSPRPMIRNR